MQGSTAIVNGKRVTHLCSNDYLGLSRNPLVLKACRMATSVSSCSSRLLAGNDPVFAELESILAKHRGCEAAAVFPSGYSANLGVIQTVADKNTAIFSDELNHASIVDGCRLAGARVKIFKHNNADDLSNQLHENRIRRKIVITEGIFSMDGDMSSLSEISRVAREHDALVIVDDAHSDFIYGKGGGGTPKLFKCEVDIHVSSLSKALGCHGGYVATREDIVRYIINASRQFIYTSALPPHLCDAAMAAIPLAGTGKLQNRLWRNIKFFASEMSSRGFILGKSVSQIIPVLIGEESKAFEMSANLLRLGVFAPAIRYPTVKKGSARIRVSLTAMHSLGQLRSAADAFSVAARQSKIRPQLG